MVRVSFQDILIKSLNKNSDKIAIENEATRINYSELCDTANIISSFLLKKNLKKETFVGIFTIEMANYTTKAYSMTVVVRMAEIFPGMPTFYFIMIVGAIVAVVGSLVAYRAIQQARIPTFVKKARAMKGNIKSRKSISDSLLYPDSAKSGTYLGNYSANPYATNSTSNPYGAGNPYSPNSPNNPYAASKTEFTPTRYVASVLIPAILPPCARFSRVG